MEDGKPPDGRPPIEGGSTFPGGAIGATYELGRGASLEPPMSGVEHEIAALARAVDDSEGEPRARAAMQLTHEIDGGATRHGVGTSETWRAVEGLPAEPEVRSEVREVREVHANCRAREAAGEVVGEVAAALRRQVDVLRRELDELRAAHEEAKREEQTFLQLAAHNVKGPVLPLEVSLCAIQRALEKNRPVPPDTLRRALRQVRRLYRTVDALLVDLPGVESGSLRVRPARFDLRDPVRAAVEELQILLDGRTFVLSLPSAPVPVYCDVQRVGHIVASLLDNALKYSPEPAPIEVSLACATDEAIVAIADRGIGIPEHELDQVGTRFYRGSNAPSYIYRGLGVGLYLASAFAELCHGRLHIESAEGAGTRAELILPLSRDI